MMRIAACQNRRLIALAILWLGLAFAAPVEAQPPAAAPDNEPSATPPITVSVAVRITGDRELPPMSAGLLAGRMREWAMVDDKGHARIEATLPDGCESFEIMLAPPIDPKTGYQTLRNWPEFRAFLGQFIVRAPEIISVEAGLSEYSAEFVLEPGVQSIVRLRDDLGNPVKGGGVFRHGVNYYRGGADTDANGVIHLGGIAVGEEIEVFVVVGVVRIYTFSVPAQEAPGVVDVGTITVSEIKNGVPFTARLINVNEMKSGHRWSGPGLTLISRDGQSVFSLSGDPDGNLYGAMPGRKHYVFLLGGEYYVLPCKITRASEATFWAFDAIRAGRDLSDSGIPMLTVTGEEDEIHFEFDALAADNAIRKLMAEEEDARKRAEDAKENDEDAGDEDR